MEIYDPRQLMDRPTQLVYDEAKVVNEVDQLCTLFGVEGYYRYIDDEEYEIEWVTSGGSRFYYDTESFQAALVAEFGARP